MPIFEGYALAIRRARTRRPCAYLSFSSEVHSDLVGVVFFLFAITYIITNVISQNYAPILLDKCTK